MSRITCEWCDSEDFEWFDEDLARCRDCGDFFSPDLDTRPARTEWRRHPVEFGDEEDEEC